MAAIITDMDAQHAKYINIDIIIDTIDPVQHVATELVIVVTPVTHVIPVIVATMATVAMAAAQATTTVGTTINRSTIFSVHNSFPSCETLG